MYKGGQSCLATAKYLDNINSTIRLDNKYVQNQLRNNDMSIMNLVYNQSIYKVATKQKECINCVQMYLCVQFIIEISTINGDGFATGILDGKLKDNDLDKLNYRATLTTANQKKPNTRSLNLWSKNTNYTSITICTK